ncbi:MAG: beta-lactamase family protein [Oscillospiraceae bacterium]|nr:beta-lactamase family protein [Oscillospiraceae bacterium]
MSNFTELTQYLDSLAGRFGIPGCDCVVTVDGKLIYRHSAGFRDEEKQIPVTSNDTYWIYSATKLFTCTAALQLMEQGRLSLSDPVSKYLPEFGRLTVCNDDGTISFVEENLTIHHLMTMTGGLDYDLERPALRKAIYSGCERTRELVATLAVDPLRFRPGEHFLYSLCHDVLGAVIEVVSGMSLSDYVRRSITEPLGMTDTTFHPSEDQLNRLATQYAHLDGNGTHKPVGQTNKFRFSEIYDSGGAGLLSTVDDYIRLATALALGGVSPEGVRILSRESVDLMKTPALDQVQLADYLARSPAAKGYSYGLGVRVLTEPLPSGVPVGEFGWDGAAGAYVLIDTENRLALFYAQQVCNSYITYQYLHPELRDTLYRCIGR